VLGIVTTNHLKTGADSIPKMLYSSNIPQIMDNVHHNIHIRDLMCSTKNKIS